MIRFAPNNRSLRSLILTALAGLAAFSAAPAADPRGTPAVSDIVLARSALAALDADPQLRDVNLLVSVVDRVAVIGGPVSADELGKRAEGVVRRVPGIVEVKNRCFVQDAPSPLLRAMSAKPPESPRVTPATELPGVVPSPRTGLTEEFTPPPGTMLAAVEPTGKPVVARRPMNPSEGVLLPPVGPGSASPAPKLAAPSPPVVLTSKAMDALASAETIRKADNRFTGLTLAFANGTLVIGGSAARAADAWDLAQQLRGLPGVPRVAVGAIDVK